MQRRTLVTAAVAAVVAGSALHLRSCCRREPEPVRFATFNIEDWPRHATQIREAFEEIAGLHASFVAVQEITDPALFAAEAANRLGGAWQFAALPASVHHAQGVLYDRTKWTVTGLVAHDETALGGRYKPTIEVRLHSLGTAPDLRVLVVHLKASGDAESIAVRARQLAGLGDLLAREPPEPTILLGDFNATSVVDRERIAELARKAGLWWVTKNLECTAFWSREDGCWRSRLDHVLMWSAPDDVEAAGACATEGCGWDESCPTYTERVSDHCPVVVTASF